MLVGKEGDVDKTRESGEISHAKELSNKRNWDLWHKRIGTQSSYIVTRRNEK